MHLMDWLKSLPKTGGLTVRIVWDKRIKSGYGADITLVTEPGSGPRSRTRYRVDSNSRGNLSHSTHYDTLPEAVGAVKALANVYTTEGYPGPSKVEVSTSMVPDDRGEDLNIESFFNVTSVNGSD